MKEIKERIIITGYNGLLAQRCVQLLKDNYHIIGLTSNPKSINNRDIYFWNPSKNEIDERALENCKHIIHLAGYPVIKRWTKENKQLMYESRINASNLLFNKCKELKISPKTFISASAIGIYGLNSTGVISENEKAGKDWIARMALDWENSAEQFKKVGSRVVQMRISLLIDKNADFLKYNLLSMKLGLGILIGSRKKKISWIHLDDAAHFINEAITNKKYNGPYNLAAKKPINQDAFFTTIKEKLFPYALIIKIPFNVVKLFLGERSKIINTNQSICVDKLKTSGFIWKFPDFNTLVESIQNKN
tara:strand:- start:15009 stop:15923 length:915 start_codon:yes stop_codon:yes gene_type:complete